MGVGDVELDDVWEKVKWNIRKVNKNNDLLTTPPAAAMFAVGTENVVVYVM